MVEYELWVLGLECLGDDLAPEARAREHVRLVDGVDGQGRVRLERDLGGDARDALHLGHAVDHRVPRRVRVRALARAELLARAEVRATDELADDDDVDALGDGRLERRVREQRVGREVRGADVPVQPERLAQREQALLRAHLEVHTPFRPADRACGTRLRHAWERERGGVIRTEKDSVSFLARLERRGGERLARRVEGASSELVSLELDLDVARDSGDSFEDARSLRGDFRACELSR